MKSSLTYGVSHPDPCPVDILQSDVNPASAIRDPPSVTSGRVTKHFYFTHCENGRLLFQKLLQLTKLPHIRFLVEYGRLVELVNSDLLSGLCITLCYMKEKL